MNNLSRLTLESGRTLAHKVFRGKAKNIWLQWTRWQHQRMSIPRLPYIQRQYNWLSPGRLTEREKWKLNLLSRGSLKIFWYPFVQYVLMFNMFNVLPLAQYLCTLQLFKLKAAHAINAAFYGNREMVITSSESAGNSTLFFGSRSCTLTTWWMDELMDLPIFHGQHSSNTNTNKNNVLLRCMAVNYTNLRATIERNGPLKWKWKRRVIY